MDKALFEEFTRPLIGMELTHVWRGYGSAIFLNFGELHHDIRKTGRSSNYPIGQMSVSITWSWRVEGKRRIWFGSWSDDASWHECFHKMLGARVVSVQLFGRLPEIDVELSSGIHILSFMTERSDPEWAIHNASGLNDRALSVQAGQLRVETTLRSQRVRAEDICMLPLRRQKVQEDGKC